MSKRVYFVIPVLCALFILSPNAFLVSYGRANISKMVTLENVFQNGQGHKKIVCSENKTLFSSFVAPQSGMGVCFENDLINICQGQKHLFVEEKVLRSSFPGGIFQWLDNLADSILAAKAFPEKGTISYSLFALILKTLFILFLALVIWNLIRTGLCRLSKHADMLKERCPELEEHLCSYSRVTGKALGFLLIIILILSLLQIWGLNVFGFLSGYSKYIYAILRIPLVLAMALILAQVSKFIIFRLEAVIKNRMKLRPGISEVEIQKQIKTIGGIIYKTATIIIWVMALMMIMKELGFDIKPILASVGIVGLAVGFGAQNLVRDIITGLFMIIENQIRVGDVAILNGTGGLVEAINLRTTVLRGLDGAIHVFPNGSVTALSNLTHNYSYYLFEIGVAYKEDVDRVVSILKQISDEAMADPAYGPDILEPLEVLGLDKFGDSAIIIKARIKTMPIKQWTVGRAMNRLIKKRFDEENIEIPFPHMAVYFGEASKPFDLRLKEHDGAEKLVKGWVREAIAEDGRSDNKKPD